MSTRHPLKDIQFIADFAAFCRTKGEERYDYYDTCNCACAQFLVASGRAPLGVTTGGDVWFAIQPDGKFGERQYLPGGRAIGRATANGVHTWSALADRLEALLVDAPEIEVVK